jgi:hypothetical protein
MSVKGKIVKHHSLLHADRILTELRKIWPETWEGWLRVWANGREQGYHLTVSTWDDKHEVRGEAACLFAEGRSCDGALVVIGHKDKFAAFGNPEPTVELWKSDDRKYFYDTTGLKGKDGYEPPWEPKYRGRKDKLAAQFIVKRFRKLLAESREEWRGKRAKAG